jgi:hypothetical protein
MVDVSEPVTERVCDHVGEEEREADAERDIDDEEE